MSRSERSETRPRTFASRRAGGETVQPPGGIRPWLWRVGLLALVPLGASAAPAADACDATGYEACVEIVTQVLADAGRTSATQSDRVRVGVVAAMLAEASSGRVDGPGTAMALDALELAWTGSADPADQAAVERGVRATATRWHIHLRTARKAGGDGGPALVLAERAYRLWFRWFPLTRNEAEMRYSYAELLYAEARYDAAFHEYRAVVALDPRSQHAQLCARSAIFAAQEMAKRESTPGGARALSPWGIRADRRRKDARAGR